MCAAAPALLLAAPVSAEEAHRQLGAHVHGHGKLSMAVEGTRVELELDAPGMDILGFEHAASTPEQTAALEAAKKRLSEPLTLFKLPDAAACKVAKAEVKLESEHAHEGEHESAEHEDKDHGAGDHDDDHDHEGHDHAGHSEFHATYTLDCASPASLTTIGFDYFKAFAGAKSLTVDLVSAKSQGTYEVSRDKPDLTLSGIM